MSSPTPDDVADAIPEIAAARTAVGSATNRELPVVLAATSVLTFLDSAEKDEIASSHAGLRFAVSRPPGALVTLRMLPRASCGA